MSACTTGRLSPASKCQTQSFYSSSVIDAFGIISCTFPHAQSCRVNIIFFSYSSSHTFLNIDLAVSKPFTQFLFTDAQLISRPKRANATFHAHHGFNLCHSTDSMCLPTVTLCHSLHNSLKRRQAASQYVSLLSEVSLFIINPDIARILLLSIRCHRHELSCFNQLLSKMKLIPIQNYTFVQDSYRNTAASASSSVFRHSFSSTSHLASSPVIHLGNHLFTCLIHPYVHTSIVSQPSVREGLPL